MIYDQQLLADFKSLPPDKQAEVIDFIAFLKSKTKNNAQQSKSRGSYGSLQGTFTMTEDFDAPLEDFQEYM